VGDLSTVERRRRTMRYPSNLVFQRFDPELFLLRLYGDNASFKTNNLRIIQSYSPVTYDVDMKFILLPSSKMWKYDNDKYSSYINHENPSFVFEMDASSVFEDYTLHQEAHQLLPDLKRWLYGYAKTMASTTLSSSGIQLPYSNSDLSVNQIESNILIEVWDSQAQVSSETIPNWRPISMSIFDDGKSPGSVILDELSVYAGPSYHGDYVSYVFEKLDMTNGIFNFAGAGYSDVLGFVGLTNKALYDMENGRVYHVVNTASEDGGARLRIYFKYDPINDPALQLYNPVQGAVGQISIHEPLKFISRSKENEIYTSEASTIESDGIQKRMIDVRNTVADSSGLTDLMRYVDSDNKISFRVHVLRDRDYPKAFYTKSADIFQYTNFNAVVPTPADINPWISGATAWDWSLVGLTEDVKYVGMSYFQLLSK